MRTALAGAFLPFTAWLGALQATTSRWGGIDDVARFIGITGVLGTLTVLIYRLGVWRQEMENTRNNVGAELKVYREESTATLARLERRLDVLEQRLTSSAG